jgi:hypothetical protein
MLFRLSCLIRVYRRNLTKSVFIFLLYVYVVQSQHGQEAVQEGSRPQPQSSRVVVAVIGGPSGVVKSRAECRLLTPPLTFFMFSYVYVPQAEPEKEPTKDAEHPNLVLFAQATTSKVSGGHCGFRLFVTCNNCVSFYFMFVLHNLMLVKKPCRKAHVPNPSRQVQLWR